MKGQALSGIAARRIYAALATSKFFYDTKDGRFHYDPLIEEYAKMAINVLRGKTGEAAVSADTAPVVIPGGRRARKNEPLIGLKSDKFTYVRDLFVDGPNDIAEIYRELKSADREKFIVMALDKGNKLIGTEVVSMGSLNYNLVHPREVFKTPVMLGAAKIICLHNHPSGTNQPSDEDLSLTKRLRACGDIVGIEMAYHVILGHNEWAAIYNDGHIERERLYVTEAPEQKARVPEYEVYQKILKHGAAILKPRDAVEAAKHIFEKNEKANIVFMLNTRNEVLTILDLQGASNAELLKRAVCVNAASMVVCTGEKYDTKRLSRLIKDTKNFGIELLDMVEVIGKDADGHWQQSSHKQNGTLKEPEEDYGAASESGRLYKTGEDVARLFERGDFYQPDLFKIPAFPKKLTEAEGVELLTVNELFTTPEKTAIKEMVEGAGGRAPDGAEGRGLLDEYYTPPEVVDKVWDLVDRYFDPKTTALNILEPSIGVGRLFQDRELHEDSTITGFEINPAAARAARIMLQGSDTLANVLNSPFESLFMDERGNPLEAVENYDLVLGNPPYGDYRGRYKGLGEEKRIHEYSEYFLKRSLNVTKEGGLIVFVMPSGFLRNKENHAKKEIAKLGNLLEAYRLPNGIFPTTDIGTDLVIFQKDTIRDYGPKLAKLSDDAYFVANADKIIGAAEQLKNRFGDMEQFIKGDTLDVVNYSLPERSGEYIAFKPGDPMFFVGKVNPVRRLDGPADESALEVIAGKKSDAVIPVKESPVSGIEYDLWVNTDAHGAVRPDFLRGKNPESLKDHLNYYKGAYYNNFNYYQGDIYEKLKALEADKENIPEDFYQKQKAGLEAVRPAPATIKDIRLLPIDPLAGEIKFPGGDILLEEFEAYIEVLPREAFEDASEWEVRNYLEGRPVTGRDPERNAEERRRRKEIAEKLFNKFLKEELPPAKQEILLRYYNERRNAVHKPDYSRVPLISKINATFKGEPIELRHYQTTGIGFLANKGVGCLAHEVGAGKTMSAIITINELLTRKWIERPLLVVPKSVYKKWIYEITEIIPGAKINALGSLSSKYVKGEKLNIEPGTITVITTEGMNRLGFKKETYDSLLSGLKDTIAGFNTTKRQQAFEREKADELIGKGMKGTSDKFFFEDIGFDQIVMDEMHRAKNIFVSAKLEKNQANEYRNVRGGRSSMRAVKMYLATQYILKRHAGRGVIGLTATPFSNSPMEYYSILALLAKEKMERMGLSNVNAFMTAFMDMKSTFVIKADRTLAQEDVIERFKNANQLRLLIGEYIDYKGGDELGIKRPVKHQKKIQLPASGLQWDYMKEAEALFNDRDAGGAIVAVTELQSITLSPYLSRYHEGRYRIGKASDDYFVLFNDEYIKVQGESVKINPERETFACKNSAGIWSVCDAKTGIVIGGGPSKARAVDHAMYVFQNDRRHITNIENFARMSPRFKTELAFTYAEFVNNSPKIKWTMDAIREVSAANKEANQIIYMPRGVEYHPLLREYLVKELGFKDSEVEIVSGLANSKEDEIEDVKERFNSGEIKILIGSEIIKEGMDLQKKTTDLYHLHLPWNPVDLDQVEGRLWRYGNEWEHVRINYPLIENSVDPFIFQKLETKQKRISHAKQSTENEVDVSDLNFEELKLDLITDPVRKKQAEKTMAMHKLSREINVLKAEIAHSEFKLKGRAEIRRKIESQENAIEYAKQVPGNTYFQEQAKDAVRKKDIYEKKLIELNKRLSGMDAGAVNEMLAKMRQELALKEKQEKKTSRQFDKEIETLRRWPPVNIVHDEMQKTERYRKSLEDIRRENPVYLVKDLAAGDRAAADLPAELKVSNTHLLQKVDGLDALKEKHTAFMGALTEKIIKTPMFEPATKKKIVDMLNSAAGAKLIARHSEEAEVVIYAGLCMAEGRNASALDRYDIPQGIKKQVAALGKTADSGVSFDLE